jgi:hypothetical protein
MCVTLSSCRAVLVHRTALTKELSQETLLSQLGVMALGVHYTLCMRPCAIGNLAGTRVACSETGLALYSGPDQQSDVLCIQHPGPWGLYSFKSELSKGGSTVKHAQKRQRFQWSKCTGAKLIHVDSDLSMSSLCDDHSDGPHGSWLSLCKANCKLHASGVPPTPIHKADLEACMFDCRLM